MKYLLLIFTFLGSGLCYAQSKPDTLDKVDTVYFTPKPDQLKALQEIEVQIEQLKIRQLELIMLLIGEPVEPKTIEFDGRRFKAIKKK